MAMQPVRWRKLVERESDFWKNYQMIVSVGDVAEVFGCRAPERLTTRRGLTFTHWLNPQAVWRTSRQVEAKLATQPNFVSRVSHVFHQARRRLLGCNRRLQAAGRRTMSDRALLQLYHQFCGVYRALYAPFHLAVYLDSVEDRAKEWLASALRCDVSTVITEPSWMTLTSAPDVSPVQEEELALLRLALAVRQRRWGSRQLAAALETHWSTYAGLPVVNDEVQPWNRGFFNRRLKKFLQQPQPELERRYRRMAASPARLRREQRQLLRRLTAPVAMQRCFAIIQLATWIRLTARHTFALAHHAARPLFGELGRRCGRSAAAIKWLTPQEMEQLLLYGRQPNPKHLADRQRVAVLLYRRGRHRVMVGRPAEQFIRRELPAERRRATGNNLRGTVAFPGLVTGPVRIIRRQSDLPRMRRGAILVARMTTPELLPAVHQAQAIVTDEGGLTCHAAIVARELGIPCIIGTKVATQVLKDGDRVEVDANHGVVKVLKQWQSAARS